MYEIFLCPILVCCRILLWCMDYIRAFQNNRNIGANTKKLISVSVNSVSDYEKGGAKPELLQLF